VDVQPLASSVTLFEIEAKRDDRTHGLVELEALPLSAARVEERAQRRGGGSSGRLCAATDAR
jgi:hypothetical protein